MEEAANLFGSLVALRAKTTKTISPGFKRSNPFCQVIFLQPGGKILDTETKLKGAKPASLKAASKEAK